MTPTNEDTMPTEDTETGQATDVARAAARAAALETNRIRKALADNNERSKRRRHYLRVANDGGVTYAALVELTGMASTAVGNHISQARAEAAAGDVPDLPAL